MKKALRLFFEIFRISLFVIGGGYAILAVADTVFAKIGWTEEGELLDHLPVFQMVPGIIATHTAVYVGRKMLGWRGVVIGVVAAALPSVAIFTLVAAGFDSLPVDHPLVKSAFVGLRAALTGVIAATVIRSWRRNLPDVFAYSLLTLSLALLLSSVSVWAVLLVAMALGLIAVFSRRETSGTLFRSSPLALLLFLKYGLLCFGGGFVLVPMYIEDFVGPAAPFLQIAPEEFSNLMALTQMTPGPIGVNGATYFGYRLAGVGGAVLASLLLLAPGSLLCYAALESMDRFRTSRVVCGILKGARPASVALMLSALLAFARMSFLKADGSVSVVAILLVLFTIIATMKKKLSPMLLVVLCSLASLVVRADDAVTCETYPNADTVVLDEVGRVEYLPDGCYVETSESWTKILTEKGRRDESTYSLSYSKRYSEAEILFVGIIGTNGVERAIDLNATTREATDNSSMSSNIYDPLDRQIVCTIPGLQVGETVHVRTRRAAFKARCEGVWADLAIFEWTCPILRSSLEIVAPKERPLKRIAVRHPLGNLTSSTRPGPDGSTIHVFASTNSPQAFGEPDMPALYTQIQHLLVSTASDWPEISRWYWNLCTDHLAKTNAAMVAKVKELTDGAKDREAAMRAVFRFVSQEVRYMGLTMEDTSPGYAPHDVDITFDNRYGVCRDKAALLVAMLRLAGFEAYPSLINVGPKQDPEVPKPFFNHAIVAVRDAALSDGAPYILMDPTNENAKDLLPAYESDKSYLVATPEGDPLRTTPTPSPDHNALKVASRATLEKSGAIFLESTIRMNGINDTSYRGSFVKMKQEDRIKFFERVVKTISPGAELVRCEVTPRDMRDTETPIMVSLAARFPEMILAGETRKELTIPFLSRTLGTANYLLGGSTSLEKRRFDLEVELTAAVDETIEIDLDAALGAPIVLPEPLDIKGGYEFTRAFTYEDGRLSVHRRAAIAKTTFSPEEYAILREDIKRTEAAERERVVFAVDPLADANLNWIEESTEVDIHSPRAWTMTTRIVEEVLTYKAKKASAELKIGYSPYVEKLELVSAVVSNRNGTVTAVTPKEINEMDCGWAASAPRYPASKILVVNLPSVEIGSVISYTLVQSVTNAPLPFYGEFGFDSVEPLRRCYARVNDWSREVLNPKRLPNEPGQPAGTLWRDRVIVSSNDFAEAARTLRRADDVSVSSEDLEAIGFTKLLRDTDEGTLRAIRDWMVLHVRVVGPGLWELPLDLQLTAPSVVLKERYATRLDYMRTLLALVRAAGLDASLVYVASDANDPADLRARRIGEKPDVGAFATPVVRVMLKKGGLFGSSLFADETAYFIGTENEWTPLGASAHARCTFFDPLSVSFGEVSNFQDDFADATAAETTMEIDETGAATMTIKTSLYGPSVGAFRKRYAEILPEERNRFYQSLVSGVAQAARATSDLQVDVEDYPATRVFSCAVPDYATVAAGAITLQLPPLVSSIPTFVGSSRQTPFAVGATSLAREKVTVLFPKGYTRVEHLPESFAFASPDAAEHPWLEARTSSRVVDGHLEVTIERVVLPRLYSFYAPDVIELVRDRHRIAASRANRTIVVRKE